MKSSYEYLQEWRKKNPKLYLYYQMRWYYRHKKRIVQGWSKPKSGEDDEYDKWLRRFEID